MPLPVFYLEFRKQHGRDPTPAELTLKQRRHLLKCCQANRARAESHKEIAAELERKIQELSGDPSAWHEALRELAEPERTQLLRLIMTEGPEAVLEFVRVRMSSLLDGSEGHWDQVIHDSVGLDKA